MPTTLAHHRLALINLYFFQIVKEQKQPMVFKKPSLNHAILAQPGDRLRIGIS
jgi:hypothetical protein